MSTLLSKLVENLPEIYKKDCKGCEEEKSNRYTILLGLTIIDYVTNAKNAKKDG